MQRRPNRQVETELLMNLTPARWGAGDVANDVEGLTLLALIEPIRSLGTAHGSWRAGALEGLDVPVEDRLVDTVLLQPRDARRFTRAAIKCEGVRLSIAPRSAPPAPSHK